MGRDTTGGDDRFSAGRRSFLTGTAAATAGAVGVAGCLSRGPGPNTVVMTADSGVAGIIQGDGDGPSVQQALWDAGLNEDINIEIQTVVSDSASRMQTAQSALEAGRAPPDIHMMDSGWTVPFILRNQTVNLTEELSEDVLERVNSDYLEAILETARDPQTGDLHALPLFPDLGFTLYRQDLLEDAGYDTSGWGTDPPRWEEFASAVRDARDGAGLDYGFTTQAAAYEGLSCCTFNEVMTSWGGAYFGGTDNLFTAGERPIAVDEEPVIDAIRMMRSFIEGEQSSADQFAQICPSAVVQWTEQQSLSPFADGSAVSNRNWSFAIAQTGTEEAFGEDLGVMTRPYAVSESNAEYQGTGGTTAALGGWNLAVSPFSDRQAEALQVLEAFATEEVMLAVFELGGYLPPNLDLVAEADPDDVGPVARYADVVQLASENAIPRPATDLWPEQSALIYQSVNAAYRGVQSPEAAMNDLAEELEQSEAEVATDGD
ncbi:extracellular solute-binding protein [Natrinema thermotolerans]|uniref:Extracellular solute-binding protein n=1 Tax=Natrinema thermotolerans TaxID=121872 RepID=A0AAF0PC05_9EURY|nr:extracellular solute-binding protein [Natrinema thermotolerans]QCC60686.1 extracellular solute-binding protein [Natrinema thermotolerans]WMT07729.1 extracellular solute-binding protein [Natrinema thermotolerans]WMT08361.1 extracellular solute-binding protein [Natrinema thermotolerans]